MNENKLTSYTLNRNIFNKTIVDSRDRYNICGKITANDNEFVWTVENFSKYLPYESGRSLSSPTINHPDHELGKWKVRLVLFPYCQYHVDCEHMTMQPCLESDFYDIGKADFVFWLKRLNNEGVEDKIGRRAFTSNFMTDRLIGPTHIVSRSLVIDPNSGILIQDRIEIHCTIVVTESQAVNKDVEDEDESYFEVSPDEPLPSVYEYPRYSNPRCTIS